MQQSSATPKNQDVGRRLRKIVACSQPYIYTLQCFLVSTVCGMVSSLHLTSFKMIFTLVATLTLCMGNNTRDGLLARAIDQACTRARLVKLRICEVKRVVRKWRRILYSGNFWSSQSRLLKVQIVCLHQRIVYQLYRSGLV